MLMRNLAKEAVCYQQGLVLLGSDILTLLFLLAMRNVPN